MSGRVTQPCATVIQQGKGKAAKKTKNSKKTKAKEKMMMRMMKMMMRMMTRMRRKSFDVLCHFSSTEPGALSTGH